MDIWLNGGWIDLLALAAAVGSGLMAGLFFVFSNAIMRALSTLENERGMAAMQAINAVILNPLFMLLFVGTALLCAVGLATSLMREQQPGTTWLLSGSLLYLIGGFGITAVCNVPLNNRLAALHAGSPEGRAFWLRYVSAWTKWNHVRTLCCVASLACFVLAAAA